ncbi:hypothetical protein BMR08_18045 [Methylococcaceae bacterium CS2]|nr:hypothetical protein BMR08_18045 [Methylococcaceae bacterium CS2]
MRQNRIRTLINSSQSKLRIRSGALKSGIAKYFNVTSAGVTKWDPCPIYKLRDAGSAERDDTCQERMNKRLIRGLN